MENLVLKVLESEKTKDVWRGNYNSIEWNEANELNIFLFGISLNRSLNCNCIEDLFFMIKNPKINEKIKNKMEKKFIVKKDVCLSIMALAGDNLTIHSSDEQCIEVLRISKAYSKFFEILPENWEAIIDGMTVSKPKSKKKTAIVEEVENTEVND